MRLILILLAVLAAVTLLLLLIGWLLPATREGRAETVIAAAPARIVAVIADVQSQPDWRDGVRAVTGDASGWTETTTGGERITFSPVVMTETRIALRFTSDAGYSGEWRAELKPVPGGTRITVLERGTVPSPFGRLLARLFFDPQAFATTYLGALKARSEQE